MDEARTIAALRRSAPSERSVAAAADAAGRMLEDRAIRSRLADAAYSFVDSPFGPLLVAVTRRGLVRLEYPGGDPELSLREMAAVVSPRIVESPAAIASVARELEEYFEGRRRSFDVPVDLSMTRGFARRVLHETAGIPFGSVATYRDIASGAGNALATRAAGNALGANPVPIVVPCHRVVRTGGGLGGYTGGLERKTALLRLEGVVA